MAHFANVFTRDTSLSFYSLYHDIFFQKNNQNKQKVIARKMFMYILHRCISNEILHFGAQSVCNLLHSQLSTNTFQESQEQKSCAFLFAKNLVIFLFVVIYLILCVVFFMFFSFMRRKKLYYCI